ncbi:kinase [Stappia sp. F7233]|uniref:Kinase n=1 Tax=Stappia albiluteola TaxID=2758565 RepID=A0A839A909_9HYPH|nr:kinase [Stappia albiluteola]MBA5775534.1 kinase [Stappia albiluteola]
MVQNESTARYDQPKSGKTLNGGRKEGLLQVGVGRAIAHHGELLQGVFEGEDGRLHRGLVTLPLAARKSTVTFWPNGEGAIRCRPANRKKAARAAALTFNHLGYSKVGGDLTLESDIPVGHGYGSSTADVIAAIRAAAAAAGVILRRSTVCKLAVEAEEASDAIAYGDQVVLFAHREGLILEHFGGEYPPLLVVGFRIGRARPIATLRLPRARYDGQEIEQFRVLRGLTSHAVRQQDPRLIGRVATASARISQHHLAKPRFEAAVKLAEEHGACGIQVAHSGTLLGVLFDADERGVAARAAVLAETLGQAGFLGIMTFTVNVDGTLLQ